MSPAPPNSGPCMPVCYYCQLPFTMRHEHDHFPFSRRDLAENPGLTELVVCACIKCHDIKDRLKDSEVWQDEIYEKAFRQVEASGTYARILLAHQVMCIMAQASAIEALEAELATRIARY